jgi:glutathione S-transferase
MVLYHFRTSTFAHRVRLVLAMKGLSAELRDPRADAKWWPELHARNPLRTVPTLIDGDRVFTDSLTIVAHLEGKVASPSIWPRSDLVEAPGAARHVGRDPPHAAGRRCASLRLLRYVRRQGCVLRAVSED